MTGTFSLWHVLVILIAIALFVLFVVAVVGIVKTSARVSDKALWILIAFFLPLIGPVLWFTLGKPRGGSFTGAAQA